MQKAYYQKCSQEVSLSNPYTGYLMPHEGPDVSKVERHGLPLREERRLQDAGREEDLVPGVHVEGVDGGRREGDGPLRLVHPRP